MLLSAGSSSPFDQPINRLEKELKSHSFEQAKQCHMMNLNGNKTFDTCKCSLDSQRQVDDANCGFVISILLHHSPSTFSALGRWSHRPVMLALSMKDNLSIAAPDQKMFPPRHLEGTLQNLKPSCAPQPFPPGKGRGLYSNSCMV